MQNVFKLIIAILISIMLVACSPNNNHVTGAGSSFIYPALSIWARDYAAESGTQINYQAIGSGGGLQQIYSGTIDFAASDMPLTAEELTEHKLQQYPMIIGGIVIGLNVPGIANNQLTLSGSVLENIYMGEVQYWDDLAIKNLNPGVNLPHQKIVTIHRADGSGTTFNFTNYLSKVSPEWQQHIGTNTTVAWPGAGIGAKGNAGVAAQIQQTPYSLGYIEYAYAQQNNMVITKMINRDNKVVTADSKSFTAAAENANWNANNGYYLVLTNQPGAESWPIVATTFVLVPNVSRTPEIHGKVLDFFRWSYLNGSAAAQQLGYIAIPKSVYGNILKAISK